MGGGGPTWHVNVRRHVTDLRERRPPPERIFVELFEFAARRLGGLWDNDECDFWDVASGMARLHLLLAAMECDREARFQFDERSILMSTIPGYQHSFGIAFVEKLLTAWGLASEGPKARVDGSDPRRRERAPIRRDRVKHEPDDGREICGRSVLPLRAPMSIPFRRRST